MKKLKNHQCARRKYRFDIVGHKKALKIWWDSPFKCSNMLQTESYFRGTQAAKPAPRNKNNYEGYNFDQRRSSIDSYKDNSSS